MNKGNIGILILLITLIIAPSAMAGYIVDGSVSDWGIDLNLASSDGYLDGVSPTSPTANSETEDDNSVDGNVGYLNPGWGGQTFDVEAMYFDNDATTGYLAIITGFPITGAQNFLPGDLGISADNDFIYEYGIDLPYDNGVPVQLETVSAWTSVFYPDYGTVADPFQINASTDAGDATFAYSGTATNSHYVYEFSFLLADLGLENGGDVNFHWTMGCGNDFLVLQADVNPVPEPASMLLLGIGLIGLGIVGRKRLSK